MTTSTTKNLTTAADFVYLRTLIRGGAYAVLNAEREGAGLEALLELLASTLVAGCGSDAAKARGLIR